MLHLFSINLLNEIYCGLSSSDIIPFKESQLLINLDMLQRGLFSAKMYLILQWLLYLLSLCRLSRNLLVQLLYQSDSMQNKYIHTQPYLVNK